MPIRLMAAVRLISVVALLPLVDLAENRGTPALTRVPNGPYRIAGNRILDRQNRPYLIRGTQLAPLTPNEADEKGSGKAFGPLSPTTLITIRQRLNTASGLSADLFSRLQPVQIRVCGEPVIALLLPVGFGEWTGVK